MKPINLLVVCLSLARGQLSPKIPAKPVKIDIIPLDDVACSAETRPRVLSDPTGTFVSPNYPGQYPNSANCWWLIVTDQQDHVIELDFDVFQTEAAYDGVIIHDGDTTSSPFIAGFDGSYNPVPTGIRSSGPSMLFRFIADNTVTNVGFSATYTAVPNDQTPDACSSATRPLTLTGDGNFTSNGFPNYYWNYADCQWLITSSEVGGTVELAVDFFKSENDLDFLNIYDGDSSSGDLLTSLTGSYETIPGPFQSTGSSLFLEFSSDQTIVDVGFSASYKSIHAK